MKVTTDACLFGAWVAKEEKEEKLKEKKVLDIGAGTGLLSLMFMQKNPAANVHSIEIDKDACEQAIENVHASSWKERIKVFEGDVKNSPFISPYDIIISNPPFYENELTSPDAKKNMAHHHESLLLDDLAPIIRQNLKPTGTFYLLLPYKRKTSIAEIFIHSGLDIIKLALVRQSTAHDYFRVLLKGRIGQGDAVETVLEEISIANKEKEYTPEFISLLKDYYLHL